MNFDKLFQAQLDQLKDEGNYRIFAELQRKCGAFPRVRNHSDGQDEVTVWCSNDYLGMGQHPTVIEAMRSNRRRMRHRGRGHAQHLGQRVAPQAA